MEIISHRGNMFGPDENLENNPRTIEMASNFFKVEVDIRKIGKDYWLGHDNPMYLVRFDWLIYLKPRLLLHCKNDDVYNCHALSSFHRFRHEEEDTVTCSLGNVLKHPNYTPIPGSYNMMPEKSKHETLETIFASSAVCTDYPALLQTIKERNAENLFSNELFLESWV